MPNRCFLSDLPIDSNFMTTLVEKWTAQDISHRIQKSPTTSIPSILETTVKVMKLSERLEIWILDSGASTHSTHNLRNTVDYQGSDVLAGFGKGPAKALAFGSVRPEVFGDTKRTVTLSEVYFVLEIRVNLQIIETL